MRLLEKVPCHLLRAAVWTGVAGLVFITVAHAQNPPGLSDIDHQKVYVNQQSLGIYSTKYTIADQWGSQTTSLLNEPLFSLPASKNNEGIASPHTHYSWWRPEGVTGQPARTFVYRTQFGDAKLTTAALSRFLVPALKNEPEGVPLPNEDHFTCYDAQGFGPTRTVTLQTQFGTEVVDVGRVVYWCNPAMKVTVSGVVYPILHPSDRLVCYEILPRTALNVSIVYRDQIWTDRTGILGENLMLCVPALQDPPTPAESRTWSRVKAQYRS